ncbi:MAG: class I SAM-dependent methyltransferase [Bacteroidales bacterium]
MNEVKDIFGFAFKDFLNGNVNGKFSVSTDIAGIEELPVMYFFRGEDELPEWEKKAMEMCKGRVLDVGAGAGSHALILQNKGFDVTAIDISPGAVEIMKQRGVINAVCKDFFDYNDEKKFDTIAFIMNGIGVAETLDGLKKTFDHCSRLLKPGGQIILESSDLLYLYEQDDGSYLIDLAGKYYGEIEYTLAYNNFSGNPFKWLFVDFENMADAAKACGFIPEMIFEGDNHNYLARLKKV